MRVDVIIRKDEASLRFNVDVPQLPKVDDLIRLDRLISHDHPAIAKVSGHTYFVMNTRMVFDTDSYYEVFVNDMNPYQITEEKTTEKKKARGK